MLVFLAGELEGPGQILSAETLSLLLYFLVMKLNTFLCTIF